MRCRSHGLYMGGGCKPWDIWGLRGVLHGGVSREDIRGKGF